MNNKKIDKTEKIIKNSIITLSLLLIMILWSAIPTLILNLLGINYKTLTINKKVIILFISDITFFIFIITIYQKKLLNDFKKYFNKEKIKNNLRNTLKYWIIGFFIMYLSNGIIYLITKGKLATNEEMVRSLIKVAPTIMLFEVAIYAPIIEELIFRHSIKNITNNKYIYPLLSGLIFGTIHIISSLNSLIDLIYIIPYTSLGIAFALLYQKTNNIFSTITAHSIHNSLAFILLIITHNL